MQEVNKWQHLNLKTDRLESVQYETKEGVENCNDTIIIKLGNIYKYLITCLEDEKLMDRTWVRMYCIFQFNVVFRPLFIAPHSSPIGGGSEPLSWMSAAKSNLQAEEENTK